MFLFKYNLNYEMSYPIWYFNSAMAIKLQNAKSSNAPNQNTNNEYRYSFRFIQAKLDINTDLTRGILNQSSDPSHKVGYNFQHFNNTPALLYLHYISRNKNKIRMFQTLKFYKTFSWIKKCLIILLYDTDWCLL